MPYNDLLDTPEWRAKRLTILSRDNHTCQRCGFEKTRNRINSFAGWPEENIIISDLNIFLNGNIKIIKFIEDTGDIYCKTSKSSPDEFLKDNTTFICNFVLKEKIKYPYVASMIHEIKDSFFDNSFEINSAFINAFKLLHNNEIDFNLIDFDRQGFYIVERKNENEFLKHEDLHVHHKCYRKTKKIWEQEDSEYVTLCNICHIIVHETQLIPYFNEHGNIYQFMKPCWKCGGQRYFNCYKHRDNGICYACNGRGYQTDY